MRDIEHALPSLDVWGHRLQKKLSYLPVAIRSILENAANPSTPSARMLHLRPPPPRRRRERFQLCRLPRTEAYQFLQQQRAQTFFL